MQGPSVRAGQRIRGDRRRGEACLARAPHKNTRNLNPAPAVRIALLSVCALSLGTLGLRAQPLQVTHLAGSTGGPGSADGTGADARFARPAGVGVDGAGNVYVADEANHTIRKITPAGVVTTLAGLAGVQGSTDGAGAAARFTRPHALAVDPAGTIYVGSGDYTIRQVSPGGVVTTIAGLPGNAGVADGTGALARFSNLYGMGTDPAGNVYVSDSHAIRKMTPAGVVTTIAGVVGSPGYAEGAGSAARFFWPGQLAVDAGGTIYVADGHNFVIRKVTQAGVVTNFVGSPGVSGFTDGTGSAARFSYSYSLTIAPDGTVYVADYGGLSVRKVTPAGVVTTLAGGCRGLGIGLDTGGNVYVPDPVDDIVHKVTAAGVVSVFAGAPGVAGNVNATGAAARFSSPQDVAVDAEGVVYVADANNGAIRKVTPAGAVTTLASGFVTPQGLAVDGAGTVYVANYGRHTIQKVSPGGVVTTLAGFDGTPGSADGAGTAARFNFPTDVAVDDSGTVYVADGSNHTIRRITPAAEVTTLAGLAGSNGTADGNGSAARFHYPTRLALDTSGNVLVGSVPGVRKVTPSGIVTTLPVAGTAVAVDSSGALYSAEVAGHVIRRMTPAGVVTVVAGSFGWIGSVNGTGTAARFDGPSGIAVDAAGTVYIADSQNHAIRKGVPDTSITPLITSVTPNVGPFAGGTAVTLAGTNLAGAISVTVGGAAASIGSVTATAIVTTTPAGTPGARDIVVVTPNGTATVLGGFTYTVPPALTGVTPGSGPLAGGTSVTLTGTTLGGTTAVTIGGLAATLVSVSATSVVVTTPPGSTTGAKTVVATTPNGNASLANGFTYAAESTVTDETSGDAGQVVPTGTAFTQPALSADGRFVAYVVSSDAAITGDTNGVPDIVVRDRATGRLTRVSVASDGTQANGPSGRPRISASGRYVAFWSEASTLVPGDSNGARDVFVHDRDADADGVFDEAGARATVRVSVASSGAQGNGSSAEDGEPLVAGVAADGQLDLSADGLWVAFRSAASNLAEGDTNGVADIFLHSVAGRQTTRVSVAQGGTQGDGASQSPGVAAGGRRIVFASSATNLVPGDGNGARDVFVVERETGQVVRLSTTETGGDADGPSDTPAIDDAGRVVVFATLAQNLLPPLAFSTSVQIVVATLPAVSVPVVAGGRVVAGGLISITDVLKQIASGVLPPGTATVQPGNGHSTRPEVCGDGTCVGYATDATNLTPGTPDTNGVRDGVTHAVVPTPPSAPPPAVRVSTDASGNQATEPTDRVAVGGGGPSSVVAMESAANLTPQAAASNPTGVNVFVRGAALVVGTFAPLSARVDQPVPVTVTGAGFQAGAQVVFGTTAQPATLFGGTLTSQTPTGGSPRVVPVSVRNPDGTTITLFQGFTFLAPPGPTTDGDGDGLPDAWETQLGLSPQSAAGADGSAGDPDADGRTNTQEHQAGTHPTAVFTRYLAEGATSTFFTTAVGLANASETQPAHAWLRFQRSDGTSIPTGVVVPPRQARTVTVNTVAGLAAANFSTVVESDQPIAVHRTMTWDQVRGYGSHLETAVLAPATRWYLAEGSTNAGFQLFYLIQNPGATEADVEVRFLLPAGAPVVKTYTVAAGSRFNVWVNTEAEVAHTDCSAVITATNGVPIIVERAMYLNSQGQMFGAGHESAGVTEPATSWFLAEGATGPYFDLFVLLANPGLMPATVTATYLLPSGATVQKTYGVAPQSRQTVWVDLEDARLADTAVSTTLVADVPILVERAMWWPGSFATWAEAHNSFGATVTGTLWAMGTGEVGGPPTWADTYVLIANTSAWDATVNVSVLFEDGTAAVTKPFTVTATSRFNVDVRSEFPEAVGKRFGVVVESLAANGNPAAPIVVEQARYHDDVAGVAWASGANALATRIR